jgi:hypothetical protein
MDSSVSPKDEIWFLRVCHHISNAVYHTILLTDKTVWSYHINPSVTRYWQNTLGCPFRRYRKRCRITRGFSNNLWYSLHTWVGMKLSRFAREKNVVQDFISVSVVSTPVLEPERKPSAFPQMQSVRGVTLTTRPYLVSSLRMSSVITPFLHMSSYLGT